MCCDNKIEPYIQRYIISSNKSNLGALQELIYSESLHAILSNHLSLSLTPSQVSIEFSKLWEVAAIIKTICHNDLDEGLLLLDSAVRHIEGQLKPIQGAFLIQVIDSGNLAERFPALFLSLMDNPDYSEHISMHTVKEAISLNKTDFATMLSLYQQHGHLDKAKSLLTALN
tara:strand:+ start:1319 stop:1831 length:513 start_codon:yes stop_codon:yes gene_type:complete